MRNRKRYCVLMVLVFGVAAGGRAQQSPAEQIKAADVAFCSATREKGLEGWVDFFADNGYIGQTDPPVIGKTAIRQYFQGLFARKDLDFKWSPESAQVFPAGTLGYTTGRYVMAYTDGEGKRISSSGSYLTVWGKQPDGNWKVVADFGSSNARPKR